MRLPDHRLPARRFFACPVPCLYGKISTLETGAAGDRRTDFSGSGAFSRMMQGESGMKISEIVALTGAKILSGEDQLDFEVSRAFGSDLMSDVLAYADDCDMLLTGLANAQAIRTADMMDIHVVLFVRGKKPDEHMLDLAQDKDMIVLATENFMFTTCGVLYRAGLNGGLTEKEPEVDPFGSFGGEK